MENKLKGGDYVPDGAGGFVRLEGAQELLARVLFFLTCRRGSFPFLPELGSRLYLLGREKPSAREAVARQYVVEALASLDVTVEEVTVTALADELLGVHVELRAGDEWQNAELVVAAA